MSIKNIIFDVGNVLVDFAWREHMAKLGLSEGCIDTLASRMVLSPLWDQLDMGQRPESAVIADMKAAAPEYAGQIDAFFADPMGIVHTRPQSASWLRSLKQRGYMVYLLSNYPRTMFAQHTRVFDFMPYVDGKLVSSTVRLMKPDPAIYRLLMSMYSLRAEECVFVDDRPVNTEAAERLGIKTVLYRDAKQAAADLEALLA